MAPQTMLDAGRALVIAALCGGALAAHAAACPMPPEAPSLMTQGPVQASWTTEPAVPRVGEPFVMQITLCPASAKLLKVDAEMPEHRHGMNYKPSFTALGDGQWRVEGMVWHMAGRWSLKVDASLNDTTHTLTRSVILK